MANKTDPLQSRVLTEALDKVGANHCMRMNYRERNMLQLIGYEFYWMNENGVSYLKERRIQEKFGSFIEGTTTQGLKSDRDDVFIELSGVFEEGTNESSMTYEKPVIVVTDMFTPPGFVKLRVDGRRNWKSFELITENGISFLTNLYSEVYVKDLKNLVQFGEGLEKNGPALTYYFRDGPLESVDTIGAFHNKNILTFNEKFFNRRRRYGWPSKQTIATMRDQGCLFVPTGHRMCKERCRVLQWRISFSFQERLLMLNLNDTQYKCYILMKLVKKVHISPHFGLTSYHCKTSLFYTIENSSEDMWKNENLLKCFINCLMQLKKWAKKRFCPSYFIPEVNLFTGKLDDQELKSLTHILTKTIENPRHYIQEIPTDNFGKLVQLFESNSDADKNIEKEANYNAAVELQAFLVKISSMFLRIRTTLLRKIAYQCQTVSEAIHRHFNWMNALQSIQDNNRVAHLQLDDIRWALPHVSRFLHTSLASHLVLEALETNDPIVRSWLTLVATFHFWKGLQSDATSSKMKLAAVLFKTGYTDMDTLKSQWQLPAEAQPLCDCRFKREYKEPLYDFIKELYISSPKHVIEMSTSTFIEKYVSACTVFLPTEARLTPYPLKFEMHRDFGSVFTPQEVYVETSCKMSSVNLGSCATMDSKAFCLLMAGLLSKKKERKVYTDRLASVAESLQHQETTLNVLGWFASAEEINPKSLIYYKQSWDNHVNLMKHTQPIRLTTDRNAAKWHLVLWLFRAWKVCNNERRLELVKY